ncbi:syntaxin 6, N-terminal-domain-containing protein [Radiomyces spectabilis]|uniref:syntaxin 6, N-terminal-domain-containing protein n=1 Tax=Radiomyces spectabilis TaxID=64574 RepID=UPI00221F9123|nr:syntaxin 6, N-terminal-domain-containing protein [Radiomyces spectabilis]KAI8376470.1 syntaxin 6, N-terminal-domain-containing protein [Radiomyces spectabilis]
MTDSDPFLIVKRQVEDAFVNANNLFASWKRIQQTVSSPRNQELLWTADELESCLEAIEQDLDDLDEALAAAAANPQQFNLTVSELNNRKAIGGVKNLMMQEQDMHLENMSGTLVNLKEIAGTMNREIDDHVVLLDELGDHVDRTEGRLKRAMHRVTDVLKREEGKATIHHPGNVVESVLTEFGTESKSGYCICCLIIVLIILLGLVILI